MLAVELLERVVGEDDRTRPFGNAQDEGVAPADGTRRRGDHLTVEHGFAQRLALGLVDAVLERRIDDDRDPTLGVLLGIGAHRLVELGQAR